MSKQSKQHSTQSGPGLGNGLPKSASHIVAPRGYAPEGNAAPGKHKRGKQGQ
jgi:hypothetical protein